MLTLGGGEHARDCFISALTAKQSKGAMAVGNTLGSNAFVRLVFECGDVQTVQFFDTHHEFAEALALWYANHHVFIYPNYKKLRVTALAELLHFNHVRREDESMLDLFIPDDKLKAVLSGEPFID